MSQTSPKVPVESQTLKIPLFTNKTSLLTLTQSPVSTAASTPSNSVEMAKTKLRRWNTEMQLMVKCKCPHVMAADDDPFQELFYNTLFQKTVSFESILVKKEDFRLEVFSSGEELLKAYEKYKKCSCRAVTLIITDYNMGPGKLNGVETIQELMKAQYKGSILLRTSETLEDLSKTHKNLTELLQTKIITEFLDKTNSEKTRAIVQAILNYRKEMDAMGV